MQNLTTIGINNCITIEESILNQLIEENKNKPIWEIVEILKNFSNIKKL